MAEKFTAMIVLAIGRIGHFLALGARYVALISVLTCASLTNLPDALALDKLVSYEDTAEWNLFSVEQDIQLGNEFAARFKAVSQLVQEARLNEYFSRLGTHLASNLPQSHFPFSFKLIADESIQAFSFPGGPVYCTAGIMAVAENEAQLAGLVAHQMAHIILRDTTSSASRMKRFRIRAAMAAAATGKKLLLDSLEEIDLYLTPGSELMRFDLESERRATKLAAKLMTEAGYAPQAALAFFQNLQSNHRQQSASYFARHPVLDLDNSETSQALQGKTFRLVSKRNFRHMIKQVGVIQSENELLEAWVNWAPPDQEPGAVVEPREVYLTSRYSFSYPASWRQAESSETDKFQITPKGGASHSADGERIVTVGVIAGKTDLEAQFQPDTEVLLETIREIRPGLSFVSKLDYLTAESIRLEGMILNGPSPVSGTREIVWVMSARLVDSLFYMLMIAPESNFTQMKPEFKAILTSIKFYTHPENGLTGEHSQEGTFIRPQPTD